MKWTVQALLGTFTTAVIGGMALMGYVIIEQRATATAANTVQRPIPSPSSVNRVFGWLPSSTPVAARPQPVIPQTAPPLIYVPEPRVVETAPPLAPMIPYYEPPPRSSYPAPRDYLNDINESLDRQKLQDDMRRLQNCQRSLADINRYGTGLPSIDCR